MSSLRACVRVGGFGVDAALGCVENVMRDLSRITDKRHLCGISIHAALSCVEKWELEGIF